MRIRNLLAATTLAAGLTIATPALAQTTGVDEDGPGSADNNVFVDDTANDFLDLLSHNDLANGNNRDNDDNGNNRDNETDTTADHGSYAVSRGSEMQQTWMSTSGGSQAASHGGEIQNGSNIVAEQTLIAINANSQLDEVVDLDGEDASETAVGYNSGNNNVSGNAFAAYAGILNQAWNTGINSNAQAATNIAAQGTVNFGTGNSNASDGGGSGGGGD
ncbi:MAG: hypothetical protein ACK40O_08620 [Allosphingosinicella sp.]